jgi:hypothetical protein
VGHWKTKYPYIWRWGTGRKNIPAFRDGALEEKISLRLEMAHWKKKYPYV